MIDLVVKHHLSGRIRFKVAALIHFPDIEEWIKQSLLAIQGIRDVRINQAAASIVVHYDTQLLHVETLEARLSQLDFTQAEQTEIEHQYTRGDIAMNVIGILSSVLLPNKWGACTDTL